MIAADDFTKFVLRKAQWLLTEDILAGFQSGEDLTGVQMMAGCDYNRVDVRVLHEFGLFRRAISESEFARGVVGVGSGAGANAGQNGMLRSFQRRQQRACGKCACSEQTDRDTTWRRGLRLRLRWQRPQC